MAGSADKREAGAKLLLGLLLSDINENECAAELFLSALLFNPNLVEARVELGIVYGRMEAYEEMVKAFREAISLNPQAVRATLRKEPEEMERLRQILYSEDSIPSLRANAATIPAEFQEGGDLVALAQDHLAAGLDEEAVRELERSLRIDPTFPLAVSMLSVAYLLMKEQVDLTPAIGEKSALNQIAPDLAKNLFGK